MACSVRENEPVITACDGWTGQDKYKHAAFSFTLTASMYYLIKNGDLRGFEPAEIEPTPQRPR